MKTKSLWDSVTETAKGRKLYNRENLFFQFSESINKMMQDQGVSNADLADRMRVTEERITRILNGYTYNVGIYIFSDMFSALGQIVSTIEFDQFFKKVKINKLEVSMNHVYKKKPVSIEAFQMTQERISDNIDWPSWLNEAWSKEGYGSLGISFGESRVLCIETLEGTMKVSKNDWIIKGVSGEIYPCKPDIFLKIYEKVDE